MKILLEISDNKAELFLEFIKDIPFIKHSEKIVSEQITNSAILQSIQDYENGRVQPTPCSIYDLKTLIDA